MDITDITTLAGAAAIAQLAAAVLLFIRHRVRERKEENEAVYEIVIRRHDGKIETIPVPPAGFDLDAFLTEVDDIGEKDQVGMIRVPADRQPVTTGAHSLHGA